MTQVFQYLMKLHYSQTFSISKCVDVTVSVPYEITLLSNFRKSITRRNQFQYLMKLHYSQTLENQLQGETSFSTL